MKHSQIPQLRRYTLFYKQPHFRVEPRVAIKIPKIEAQSCYEVAKYFFLESRLKVAKLFDNFGLKCMKNKQIFAKLT